MDKFKAAKEMYKKSTYSYEKEMKKIGSACATILKYGENDLQKTEANQILEKLPAQYRTQPPES
jgi:hypothetical protein